MNSPIIKDHYGIKVVRDDLLPGGTKSILLASIDNPAINEFVYASPVYGGFQIAISIYCKSVNKKATIFFICDNKTLWITKNPIPFFCILYLLCTVCDHCPC